MSRIFDIFRAYPELLILTLTSLLFGYEIAARRSDAHASASPSAADQEKVFYEHQRKDPYLVTQLSDTGVVVGMWASDGKPDVSDNLIAFDELGTRHRILIYRPARYEQAPGLTQFTFTPPNTITWYSAWNSDAAKQAAK